MFKKSKKSKKLNKFNNTLRYRLLLATTLAVTTSLLCFQPIAFAAEEGEGDDAATADGASADQSAPGSSEKTIVTPPKTPVVKPLAPVDVDESPQAFLDRYYAVRANSKSSMDLVPFMSAPNAKKITEHSPSERRNPLQIKMLDMLTSHFQTGTPAKVKILSQKAEPGNRLRLALAPVVIPKEFEAQSKRPGFSMRGNVVLIKDGHSWKVHMDYWTTKSRGQFGEEESSSGFDPDGEHEKEEAKAPVSRPSIFSGYESRFRDKLMDCWDSDGPGKVHVAFVVNPDGTLRNIHVKDDLRRKEPETYARQRLATFKSIGPLSAELRSKPNVWMYIDYSKNSKAFSGPYFEETIPDHIAYDLGLKVRPYDTAISQRLMNVLDREKTAGEATVFLKLKPTGLIEKILVRTQPKNPAMEKLAYNIVAKALPFGKVPASFSSKPYFRVYLKWSKGSQVVSVSQIESPESWLR